MHEDVLPHLKFYDCGHSFSLNEKIVFIFPTLLLRFVSDFSGLHPQRSPLSQYLRNYLIYFSLLRCYTSYMLVYVYDI